MVRCGRPLRTMRLIILCDKAWLLHFLLFSCLSVVALATECFEEGRGNCSTEDGEQADADEQLIENTSAEFEGQEFFVPKCCDADELFNVSQAKCVGRGALAAWQPAVHSSEFLPQFKWKYKAESGRYSLRRNNLTCKPEVLFEGDFYFLDTGELYVPFLFEREKFAPSSFCLESFAVMNPIYNAEEVVEGAALCPYHDDSRIQFQKCCEKNSLFSVEQSSCVTRLLQYDSQVKTLLLDADYSAHFGFPAFCNPIILGSQEYVRNIRMKYFVDGNGKLAFNCIDRTYPISDYCVEDFAYSADDGSHVVRTQGLVCDRHDEDFFLNFTATNLTCDSPSMPSEGCPGNACVPKCCARNEVLIDSLCAAGNASTVTAFVNASMQLPANLSYYPWMPFCETLLKSVMFDNETSSQHPELITDELTILPDGRLRIVNVRDSLSCEDEKVIVLDASQYCLEASVEVVANSKSMQKAAIFCFKSDEEPEESYDTIIIVFLITSDVFLLITFVIYLFVPDSNKAGRGKKKLMCTTLFGQILLSYIVSLFFAIFILLFQRFAPKTTPYVPCNLMGYLMLFFVLATFFWCNVMAIDLFLVFGSTGRGTKKSRFKFYFLWGYGGSLAIVIFALMAQHISNFIPCKYRPNFGKAKCWFSSTGPKIIFFLLPVGVLLLVNFLLFCITIYKLMTTGPSVDRQSVREVSEWKHRMKQRIKFSFKLILIMGISWIFEIVSQLRSKTYAFVVFQVLNSLQGLVIFIIFICKKKIIYFLKMQIVKLLSVPIRRYSSTSTSSNNTKRTALSSEKSSRSQDDSVREDHRMWLPRKISDVTRFVSSLRSTAKFFYFLSHFFHQNNKNAKPDAEVKNEKISSNSNCDALANALEKLSAHNRVQSPSGNSHQKRISFQNVDDDSNLQQNSSALVAYMEEVMNDARDDKHEDAESKDDVEATNVSSTNRQESCPAASSSPQVSSKAIDLSGKSGRCEASPAFLGDKRDNAAVPLLDEAEGDVLDFDNEGVLV